MSPPGVRRLSVVTPLAAVPARWAGIALCEQSVRMSGCVCVPFSPDVRGKHPRRKGTGEPHAHEHGWPYETSPFCVPPPCPP